MSSVYSVSESERNLESSLKDLLEKILIFLEKFIETKSDLEIIEQELKDYENLTHLVTTIKTIFNTLVNKVSLKLSQQEQTNSVKSLRGDEEYEKLEQIIQKYEGEIRSHIRVEQQLKLYSDSLQSKLDESEEQRSELLQSMKEMINVDNNIKRDNQKLNEQLKKCQEENEQLKKKLNDQEDLLIKNGDPQSMQQQISNLQQLVQKYEKKVPNYDSRALNTLSDNRLIQQLDSQFDRSTDFPTQSQISVKQNYLLGPTPSKLYTQFDIIERKGNSSLKRPYKNGQDSELLRIYGQILKSKNNSISSIENTTGRDFKKRQHAHQQSLNASKQSSQNASFIKKNSFHGGFRINQQKLEILSQQRSKSSHQVQHSLLTNGYLKQRTDYLKNDQQWKKK